MRTRKNFFFLTGCMVVLLALMQAYSTFREYFSPVLDLEHEVSRLRAENQRQKLAVALMENQVFDFQQEVAAALPNRLPSSGDLKSFQMRGIASVVKKPLEPFDSSQAILEKAKGTFLKSNYREAILQFKSLQEKYPASRANVEASFFLAESHFLSGQFQESLDVIDTMMLQYPDSELTGFIMLRMGQIFQARNRMEDAKEVYLSVKRSFADNTAIVKQADILYRSAE